MPNAQDILASGAPSGDSTKIDDLVGQVFTITDFVFASGKNGQFVVMDTVTSDGDELKVRTGAKSVISKLEQLREIGGFPAEVKVTTYPTTKGNPGFDIVNPDA